MLLEPGLKQELSDRKTFRSFQEVVLVLTLNFPIHLLYTQQKKLRKLCLRGYDKRSKTFKDI